MRSVKAVAGLIAVAGGTMLGSISVLGAVVNHDEWEVHFCSDVQPYPVCGSIFWGIVGFIILALLGAFLIVAGFSYLGRKMAPTEAPASENGSRNSDSLTPMAAFAASGPLSD